MRPWKPRCADGGGQASTPTTEATLERGEPWAALERGAPGLELPPSALSADKSLLARGGLVPDASPMATRWPAWAWFAVTVWGGSFVATKHALGPEGARVFTPAGLVALRFLMGGGVLLAVLLLRRGPALPEPIDRRRVALLGVILGTHIGLQTWGLAFTLATHAAWIVCFTSVTIALGAQLFLGQRLRPLGWLGVAVAVAGVLGVTRPHATSAAVTFGDALQLTGCFTWAAYTLLGARPVRSSGSLRVTTWATLIAGSILAAFALTTGFGARPGASEFVALLYLGLLSSAAAFLAWYHAQATYGSQRTAATLYVEPFVTALVAAFVDEPIVLATVLGGVVVLAGVALVQRGVERPSPG
jgi:drug/metabolite transporter (DMT)-like permease